MEKERVNSGYEFSPEARNDLQEIWSYIAERNIQAADKLETEIYEACDLLAQHSRLGHKRSDLTDEPVLFWLVQNQYLVIYRQASKPLKIVRILHGARDVSSEL